MKVLSLGTSTAKLSIKLDKPLNMDGAIVVAARPVPFVATAQSPYANDLIINVSFQRQGLTFYALSDQYGVAYIGDKDFTGEMLVNNGHMSARHLSSHTWTYVLMVI